MPVTTFDYTSGGGLVFDSSSFTLANNEVSGCRNVRFRNRGIEQIPGDQQFSPETADPIKDRTNATSFEDVGSSTTIRPIHSIFVDSPNPITAGYYFIDSTGNTWRTVKGLSKLPISNDPDGSPFLYKVTKEVSGTKVPFVVTEQGFQMKTLVGGNTLLINPEFAVANSGADDTDYQFPQVLSNPVRGSTEGNTPPNNLVDLPNWNYFTDVNVPGSFRRRQCKIIEPFGNVLVAANIRQEENTNTVVGPATFESVRRPTTILVSDPFAGNDLPNWNPLDAGATTASEFDLGVGEEITNMTALGNNMIIFTTNSIFSLSLTGSITVPVRLTKLMSGRGAINPESVIEVFGVLYVVGNEDIYQFQGGSNARSISEGRIRDLFYRDIDNLRLQDVFVRHNEAFDEIWVCTPLTESPVIDAFGAIACFVYNYRNDTWSIRDLNNYYPGSLGPTNTITPVSGRPYDASGFEAIGRRLVLPKRIGSTSGALQEMDVRDSAYIGGIPLMSPDSAETGLLFDCFVQRNGINLNPTELSTSQWSTEMSFIISSSLYGEDFNENTRPEPLGDEMFVDVVSFDNVTAYHNPFFDPSIIPNVKSQAVTIDKDISVHPRNQGKFYAFRISGNAGWQLNIAQFTFTDGDRRSV